MHANDEFYSCVQRANRYYYCCMLFSEYIVFCHCQPSFFVFSVCVRACRFYPSRKILRAHTFSLSSSPITIVITHCCCVVRILVPATGIVVNSKLSAQRLKIEKKKNVRPYCQTNGSHSLILPPFFFGLEIFG